MTPPAGPVVLATGALLKNRCGLLRAGVWWPSPTHGNLDDAQACRALAATCDALIAQAARAGLPVQAVAHDLHPDFPSTRLALSLARRLGVPAIGVQHHHAHAAAVLAEHGRAGPAVALALDGHGLGLDGSAWGGEILRVEGADLERLGHLTPLALPGGDLAARQPWRMAAAALQALGRGQDIASRFGPAVGAERAAGLAAWLGRAGHAHTTSAGRWFDAAAAALGLTRGQTDEAEAACALEAAATAHPGVARTMALPCTDGVIDLRPLIQEMFALGDAGRITEGAALFHAALGDALADAAGEAARRCGLRTVLLGGGCVVNRRLRARLSRRLGHAGFEVLRAQAWPPGDAGLALGQAWVAVHRLGLAPRPGPGPATARSDAPDRRLAPRGLPSRDQRLPMGSPV